MRDNNFGYESVAFYFFDWNEVSYHEKQLQRAIIILIFTSIAWLFLREHYSDLSAVEKTVVIFFQ